MKFVFGIFISAVCSVAVRTSTHSTLPTATTELSAAGSGQGSLKQVQGSTDNLAKAARESNPGNSQEAESVTCQCCMMKSSPNQLSTEMNCQPCQSEPVNPLRRQSSSSLSSGRSSPASPSETVTPSVQNLEITAANNVNENSGNRCKKCCCSKTTAAIGGGCACVVIAAAFGCNIM